MAERAEATKSWFCEPLSGKALEEIVQNAENAADLVAYICKPEVDLDFRLKFIAEHEEFLMYNYRIEIQE
ncbi:BAF_collapsed_G0004020.mRNA.1.CDS.1 [Saccharomyces cerevisiae]|nr:BAF_collapsed_G0004020.mRNA.1.CDS.1 [Saccharomyces cerevisiae]